jgi:hypothetical protein
MGFPSFCRAISTSRRQLGVLAVAGALAVTTVTGAVSLPGRAAAAPAPSPVPITLQIQQVCGAAAPGQARRLVERAVPTGRSRALTQGTVAPSATPGGYGPADLASAYQLDTTKGYGQTVAIVDAYDDPTAAADLAVYRSQYGLPACTVASGCFSKVNQAGTTAPLPAANPGWATEISLDLDMVSAVCPQCNILLVEASSSYLSDLGTAVDTAVRLGAKFVSNSYGGGEGPGISGDTHYNHPGVAITASTGDNGYGVSYPASSPYVTAVGGTALSRSSTGRGWTETAWGGAGSGCSGYSPKPAAQAATSTGCGNRAVADVSAVASPNTGVAVYGTYGGGGWGVYGGTSASSPIIAATYALAGTPGPTDYPNSYPYANAGELYDVTAGSNGSCSGRSLCTAGTGWDGPTGLGTPNSAAAFSATGQVSGAPTRFGATAAVTGAVVAGLPVGLALTPLLPAGDSLASLSWKSARADCTFSAPAAVQTTVSCPAALVGATTVTATATDTLGTSKAVTVPLTFAAGSVKRPVSLALNVAGQSGSSQSLCTGTATPVTAVAVDTATGLPVKGLAATFTRQAGSAAPATIGSILTDATGTATLPASSTSAATLGVASASAGAFAAGGGAALPVTVGTCTPTLTGAMDRSLTYYGDPVTVTGSLTRAAAGGNVPLAGAPVQVVQTVNGHNQSLGTAISGPDGSLSTVVHPTSSGTLSLSLPAGVGWTAASAALGAQTVLTPATSLTGTASTADVGFADPVTVSGTLTRNAGGVSTPVKGATVTIRSTTSGIAQASVLGAATVGADGRWTTVVRPRAGGELTAGYAGAAGLPAAVADLGPLQVGSWTTAVSLAAQLSQLTAASGDRVTGTVTRSYEGVQSAAPWVPVGIYLQTTTGALTPLGSVSSTAAGTFSLTVAPVETGALVALVHAVPGYSDASAVPVPVTVTSRLVASAPVVATGSGPVAVSVRLTAPRAGTVTVAELQGGAWVTLASVAVPVSGAVTVPVSGLAPGAHTLHAFFAGDSRGGPASSASLLVTVRS